MAKDQGWQGNEVARGEYFEFIGILPSLWEGRRRGIASRRGRDAARERKVKMWRGASVFG